METSIYWCKNEHIYEIKYKLNINYGKNIMGHKF